MKIQKLKCNQQLCKLCENCMYICQKKGISIKENAIVIGEDCSGCGLCVKYCPERCLYLE